MESHKVENTDRKLQNSNRGNLHDKIAKRLKDETISIYLVINKL